ncbi:hypothetical protein BJ944DRAFT_267474 [Cunninghamella echinulata]|nr:hypothetical protein BJ944DRAFT_267474 [Cunninghamella echinulata]
MKKKIFFSLFSLFLHLFIYFKMNDKELLGINMEKSYKPSFYDRYIRQKKIRLDMILAVFFMIFIQYGIYFIVRYMTSTKHRNDYMHDVIEFNSSHPVYSSYPRMYSSTPSSFFSHYSRTKVNLGISGDSIAANRLVDQVAEVMISKDNRNYALTVGDLEMREDLDKSDLYEEYYNNTRGYSNKPLPTPTTPEQIIHTIDTKDAVIKVKEYMYDVDRDGAKLLRSGGIKPSPTSSNNSDDDNDDDDVTTVYQFNPKLYPNVYLRFTSQGIRVRSNITIRQEPALLNNNNNNNKDVIVRLTQSADDNKRVVMNARFEENKFNFYIHQNYNYYVDFNHVTEIDVVAEIIFPSQIKKYTSINLELYQGYSHFDQTLQNIAFESIQISTFYGAVVAEYLKTQKIIATFFNGYLSGMYEVSKDFGVATYYGKIKPIIKCSSGDVHILTAARYGTVSNFIEHDSYRGDIDIQSYENKPSISSMDVSSFSDSVVKSNSPPRLQTSYKSRLSDSHILVSAGINADLIFGNINP